jgi:hypothetical protein
MEAKLAEENITTFADALRGLGLFTAILPLHNLIGFD